MWPHQVTTCDNGYMKTIGAAEFKAHCLQILDELGPEGIVITKRGEPVAELRPLPRNHGRFIGILAGQVGAAPDDDLFSTGAWVSDEWGDLNVPPLPESASITEPDAPRSNNLALYGKYRDKIQVIGDIYPAGSEPG